MITIDTGQIIIKPIFFNNTIEKFKYLQKRIKKQEKNSAVVEKFTKRTISNQLDLLEDYQELIKLNDIKIELSQKIILVKNKITAILDEYFPEYRSAFKDIFKSISSLRLLKTIPMPEDIIKTNLDDIVTIMRDGSKRGEGIKKAEKIKELAMHSRGSKYCLTSIRMQILLYVQEYEFMMKKVNEIEEKIVEQLEKMDTIKIYCVY